MWSLARRGSLPEWGSVLLCLCFCWWWAVVANGCIHYLRSVGTSGMTGLFRLYQYQTCQAPLLQFSSLKSVKLLDQHISYSITCLCSERGAELNNRGLESDSKITQVGFLGGHRTQASLLSVLCHGYKISRLAFFCPPVSWSDSLVDCAITPWSLEMQLQPKQQNVSSFCFSTVCCANCLVSFVLHCVHGRQWCQPQWQWTPWITVQTMGLFSEMEELRTRDVVEHVCTYVKEEKAMSLIC